MDTPMFSNIHFQSIAAIDMARATAFWRDVMGFEVAVDAPYGDSRWVMLRIPGARTLLHLDQVKAVGPQEKPSLVLLSPDVDATCDRLKARDIKILNGPDVAPWDPGTRWAMIHDSEGNLILLQTIGEMGA